MNATKEKALRRFSVFIEGSGETYKVWAYSETQANQIGKIAYRRAANLFQTAFVKSSSRPLPLEKGEWAEIPDKCCVLDKKGKHLRIS